MRLKNKSSERMLQRLSPRSISSPKISSRIKSQINQLSEQVIFRIYDNAFSETELTEAIAFYKSPTGQKTAAFLPTLSAQAQKGFIDVVVPKLQQLIQPVSVEETTKLKQKVAEIKTKKPSN